MAGMLAGRKAGWACCSKHDTVTHGSFRMRERSEIIQQVDEGLLDYDLTTRGDDMANTDAIMKRFATERGWSATLDIPEGWVEDVVELDARIAEIAPDYKLAQVKEKFGSLRYYIEEPGDVTPEVKVQIHDLISEISIRIANREQELEAVVKNDVIDALTKLAEKYNVNARWIRRVEDEVNTISEDFFMYRT